jgi:hypothetical protein
MCHQESQVLVWPALVSGRYQFCMPQMMVQGRRDGRWNRQHQNVWGTGGWTPRNHKAQEGVSRGQWLIPLAMKP